LFIFFLERPRECGGAKKFVTFWGAFDWGASCLSYRQTKTLSLLLDNNIVDFVDNKNGV
jgi:hypothetical protein